MLCICLALDIFLVWRHSAMKSRNSQNAKILSINCTFFVSFYFYTHCVSIPKKCTRRDKYIVTKESFSPVSELYTTVMSLVINSQELDNLSPHLSYLISFSAPVFFAKWPISNLIVSCTLFNLNLQLRGYN